MITQSDKSRIKELYTMRPELSAKEVSKMLCLPFSDTIISMRKMGYSKESHERAKKAMLQKKTATPKVKKRPSTKQFWYKPQIEETRTQKRLWTRANALEKEMERASSEGRYEDFIKIRKDWMVAVTQAEAYQMRGRHNQDERDTYSEMSKYQIIR